MISIHVVLLFFKGEIKYHDEGAKSQASEPSYDDPQCARTVARLLRSKHPQE